MATRRCAWCGCFVAFNAQLTAWRVPVGKESRQNSRSKWNYWANLLCPSCAAATDCGVWQRTTVARVIALRGPERVRGAA